MLLAAINWHAVLFLLFALVACGFAIAVVLTSNIVRMAFYLTISLGATAGLFFLAGAEFVGSMQLLIYVGGTLVLLIFGVMLTAQDRFISMKTSGGEWVMAALLGSALLGLLLMAAFSIESWREPRADLASLALIENKTSTPIGLALTGVRVDKLDEPDEGLRRGMSGYLLPFVIVSMHLLVVLIGAGYMARTKRKGGAVPVARAAQAVARPRSRKGSVTAGLVTGIVVNFLLAMLCFGLSARGMEAPEEGASAASGMSGWLARGQELLAAAPGWLLPTLGGLFLANVLLLVVVYFWQSWAVIGLVVVPLVQAWAIANARFGPDGRTIAIVFLILALAPVIPLIVLLCTGPRPTMWEQMD
jgi:NADH:ubiquinone oxidoreductase subunit 6 (subunit J)